MQYARAFAAIAVFYYHISATVLSTYPNAEIAVDYVGAAGVDLFFVISGFIMTLVVARNRAFDPSRFMLARIGRIAPLYWLLTLTVFAVVASGAVNLNSVDTDWARLVHSLLFVPYGVEEFPAPILLVGWTLNYEMFFYALVAVCVGVLGDRKLIATAFLLCALTVVGASADPVNGYIEFYTDPIVVEFAFGIACYHCHERTRTAGGHSVGGKGVWWALFLSGLLLLTFQFEIDPGNMRPLYWGVPAFMLLLGGLHVVTFRSEMLRRIGDWSYAIYLLHLFVVIGTVRFALPALAEYGIPWWIYYALMTVILLVLSWIVHEAVEKPVACAWSLVTTGRLRSAVSGKTVSRAARRHEARRT